MTRLIATVGFLLWAGVAKLAAFDYEAHRVINELALFCLPTNALGFSLDVAERGRIAFLSCEPDRWRNSADSAVRHVNLPNHYIDLEELEPYGLTPETLPPLRYDFVAELARLRAAHPERFLLVEADKDRDHTRSLVGFLPWTIVEYCGQLKSCFGYLKAFREAGGSAEEIANARANAIYLMGVMGHFVGDAAQPLHTTVHYNGWVGDNPRGYTTNRSFHAWIDGGYFRKTGGLEVSTLSGKLRPAQIVGDSPNADSLFHGVVAFIVEQYKLVEPLYQLQKDGKLSGEGEKGLEGRKFLEGQVVKAAQMLGDLWYTAWREAPRDSYLEHQLELRRTQGKVGGQ